MQRRRYLSALLIERLVVAKRLWHVSPAIYCHRHTHFDAQADMHRDYVQWQRIMTGNVRFCIFAKRM